MTRLRGGLHSVEVGAGDTTDGHFSHSNSRQVPPAAADVLGSLFPQRSDTSSDLTTPSAHLAERQQESLNLWNRLPTRRNPLDKCHQCAVDRESGGRIPTVPVLFVSNVTTQNLPPSCGPSKLPRVSATIGGWAVGTRSFEDQTGARIRRKGNTET